MFSSPFHTKIRVRRILHGHQFHKLFRRATKSIIASEKKVALETNGGLGDDSAPRETTRQLRAANAWSAITVNLRLMELNHCTPLARVVGPDAYTFQAAKCALDSRMQPSPESCKTSLWEPGK